uniref:Major facilitator superfamily (MFS) profile domain-containing protein n=1 Tax=Monopterus albus TaxID=43700 RepID=A0A3Q3IYS1_MONAL
MDDRMKTELVSAIHLLCFPAASDQTYTVEEAVEAVGFGRFHIMLFVIMGSATIVEAMEIMLLAVASPEIRCEWHLEDWQVALVSTMVFLGFMLCGVLSGYLSDTYGRWKVVFGGFVWSTYFSLLTSFAPSYGWFIFLRSMVGCGVAAVFVLKTEFIPAKYRAYLLPLATIFWMTGSMLIILLGMLVVPTLGWRWMIRISITPSVILIFLFRVRCPLHRSVLTSGNTPAAVETLQWVAKINRASLPPGRLVDPAKERGNWRILLSSSFRRTSLLLWYSWFVASFSYYGSVLSSSELLEKNLLCVTDADQEHQVKHRHVDGLCYCIPFKPSDYQTLLISSLGEVALVPLNICLLNVFGRKWSLTVLQLLAAILFMMVNICVSHCGSVSGYGFLYIVQSDRRNDCSIHCSGGFSVTPGKHSGVFVDVRLCVLQVLMSQSVILALSPFAAACVVCALGNFLLPIETKGRALLQLQMEQSSKRSAALRREYVNSLSETCLFLCRQGAAEEHFS